MREAYIVLKAEKKQKKKKTDRASLHRRGPRSHGRELGVMAFRALLLCRSSSYAAFVYTDMWSRSAGQTFFHWSRARLVLQGASRLTGGSHVPQSGRKPLSQLS